MRRAVGSNRRSIVVQEEWHDPPLMPVVSMDGNPPQGPDTSHIRREIGQSNDRQRLSQHKARQTHSQATNPWLFKPQMWRATPACMNDPSCTVPSGHCNCHTAGCPAFCTTVVPCPSLLALRRYARGHRLDPVWQGMGQQALHFSRIEFRCCAQD